MRSSADAIDLLIGRWVENYGPFFKQPVVAHPEDWPEPTNDQKAALDKLAEINDVLGISYLDASRPADA